MVGSIAEPILVAILLIQLIAFHGSAGWRLFDSSWMVFLGRISYSIYLCQQIVIGPARRVLGGLPFALQVAGSVVFVVAFAAMSYFTIEQPFIRLKKSYSR